MIVPAWSDLLAAVDRATPCYDRHPNGDRCLDCAGCEDHARIDAAMAQVEQEMERALADVAYEASEAHDLDLDLGGDA